MRCQKELFGRVVVDLRVEEVEIPRGLSDLGGAPVEGVLINEGRS
jgi:hypothetical protein